MTIHCSNNLLNNSFGRQDALAGKMVDKNWIPTKLSNKKNSLPHKIAIQVFGLQVKKWVGRWRTNKQSFIFSLVLVL